MNVLMRADRVMDRILLTDEVDLSIPGVFLKNVITSKVSLRLFRSVFISVIVQLEKPFKKSDRST